VSASWTHAGLRARAEWLVQDVPEVGDRFGVIALGDNLRWHLPTEDEAYDEFVNRTLDLCAEEDGDAVILAWQWPELSYVTVTLACPAEGATTIAVHPTPQELH
jgi:hypothetical protein